MADDKTYVVAAGMVQAFGKDAAPVEIKDTNGGKIARFTIKTTTQQYIGITLFEELIHAAAGIKKGMWVAVDGEYTVSEGNNGRKFHNIKAYSLAGLPPVERKEREVVNAQPAATPATPSAPADPFNF